MEEKQKKHFVLVHGACHGAWCWYKIVPLLEKAGHKVTALDLAASGIHPKQVTELSFISEYHEPLMELMASVSGEERVILVGHSMGGLGISAAMERFPEKVAVGVFVAATMPSPHPGLPYSALKQELFKRTDYMDSQLAYDDGPDKPPTSLLFGPNAMSSMLYQLSPAEDLTLGLMLTRPVRLFKDGEVDAELVLTRDRYGTVPRAYVVCEEDEIVKPDKQRWMIENNPTDEVKPISGADHMVMCSKPHELCSYLLEVASRYA